jgi:pSer/pThr/pTyr-binding forkhead associated (FHA) protein
MIEDLGSTNGTLVNGKLLEGKQTLRNGDELLFQDISFRVSENYAWGDGKASALSQTTFIKPIDDADSS